MSEVTGQLSTTAPPARDIVIMDATVLPMEGPLRINDCSVHVRDGVVVAIGPSETLQIPKTAHRVDGRGRFLMPGLSEMHAHLDWNMSRPGADAATPDAQTRLVLLSYLATGVTVVRDLAGSPTRLRYRSEAASGAVLGPRLFVATPILEGAEPVWGASIQVTDPQVVDGLVADLKAQGYDFVKIYHTISQPVFDAVMEAAQRHAVLVAGHVPFEVGVSYALKAGQGCIEHLRGYDFDGMSVEALRKEGGRSADRMGVWLRMSDERMDALVRETVAAGAVNVPTLTVVSFLADAARRNALKTQPNFSLLAPSIQADVKSAYVDRLFSPATKAVMLEGLPRQRDFVRKLHEAGASLLIGTDAPIPYLRDDDRGPPAAVGGSAALRSFGQLDRSHVGPLVLSRHGDDLAPAAPGSCSRRTDCC